ncbi:MAG: ISNCY family transposase [Leptolyngbya sp.]|nr:ISNCY family transposase [Candidatus Melainabacteria bacterium]
MTTPSLNFAELVERLHQGVASMSDPRKASNATSYSLADAVLSAFAVFFMQCESFLEHQRQMQSRRGKDNAQTLFGLTRVPTNNQIKNILDAIPATALFGIFGWVMARLQQGGMLDAYASVNQTFLVALDGTEYFSSQKLCCEQCSTRTHKTGSVTYFHSAILPVIVAPGKEQVIALAPEFITPQDGTDKQDCEQAAAKRWVTTHGGDFAANSVTLLGDDLYSRQPLCELCLQHGFNFIFVCLPDSHSSLYEWLKFLDANGEVQTLQTRQGQGRHRTLRTYRWVNQIPLRETQPALNVNWCEVVITKVTDGSVSYRNAFITQHSITLANVAEVVAAGRARWKAENESHNVLKTKGYHLEHNFGHGKQHLAKLLLTLNLLAFLFHTVLHLVDVPYQQIRKQRGTRKGFFNDIQALAKYFLFESWQHLITFMLSDSQPESPTNSS